MLLKFKWPHHQYFSILPHEYEWSNRLYLIPPYYAWKESTWWIAQNVCTDLHLGLLDQETNCSIMRSIYTRTRWTFNVIWVQSWPGLVTREVKGRTFCLGRIRHTWHFVLTSAVCIVSMEHHPDIPWAKVQMHMNIERHVMWTHTRTHILPFNLTPFFPFHIHTFKNPFMWGSDCRL